MASTREEFEDWTIHITDENGNEIVDQSSRRRRRGETKQKEFINLIRSDGLSLGPGTTIVCSQEGSTQLSGYMIHEVRLNTSNYVELWCLNYLSWFEISGTEYFKQFDKDFYEEHKIKGEAFFSERFQTQCNKNEIYLTAELSEVYLKQLQFVPKILDESEFNLSVTNGEKASTSFLCRYACLPSGNNLASLDIHSYEKMVNQSNPKDSLNYLHDLTLPKPSKSGNKSKVSNITSTRNPIKNKQGTPNKITSSKTNQNGKLIILQQPKVTNIEKNVIIESFSNDDAVKEVSRKKLEKSGEKMLSSSNVSDKENRYSEKEEEKEEEERSEYEDSRSELFHSNQSSDEGAISGVTDEENDEFQSAEEFDVQVQPTQKNHEKPSPAKRQLASAQSSPKKLIKTNVVRAKRAYTPFSKRYKNPRDIPDLKDIFHQETATIDIAALEDRFRTPSAKGKVETIFSKVKSQLNSRNGKEEIVKAADFQNYLPARENEFANIYLYLYSAIEAGTSTSIYIAGTPGVGKTLTVREVVKDLLSSADQKELPKFQYIEINGLKLVKPTDSYEVFWYKISGERLTCAAAMESLDFYFSKVPVTKKRPIVVLLDELDALVTKGQDVMYNFFNWATYENAKLVVVAIANTLDLPERQLGNKVSSRIGFTRIMFTGYTHEELKTIINLRLKNLNESSFYVDRKTGSSYLLTGNEGEGIDEIDEPKDMPDLSKYKKVKLRIKPDAIEIASRKIASVSGDVRRALKVVKRAVEFAENDYLDKHGFGSDKVIDKDNCNMDPDREELQTVEISHVTRALNETIHSPTQMFISNLSFTGKLFLYALIHLMKKEEGDIHLGDVIDEMKLLIDVNGKNKYILELKKILFQTDSTDTKDQLRVVSWEYVICQMEETGILIKQNLKNERLSVIKLNVSVEDVEQCLEEDETMKTF